jgi:hypothetical protein
MTIYQDNGMQLWFNYARHRKGEVLGDVEGSTLCREASTAMRREGIINPTRWLQVVAPGRWTAAR